MGIFDNMLKSDESLFKNPVALDYDYVPKLVPFRDGEQFKVAAAIRPLFQNRNARNVIVTGRPGIGKTVAIKHVLVDLEEQTDNIVPIYINCWKKNSSYKVFLEICDIIGYKFTHNKKTDELFDVAKKVLNKQSAVFVFDEIDKADDHDFLYMILEEIYKKSVILITNYKEWIAQIDNRIKSRLLPEIVEFNPYNLNETKEIIKQRIDYAFHSNVVPPEVINVIADKTFEYKDMRTGLKLLKESGDIAEEHSRKQIVADDVKKALEKLEEFSPKNVNELEEDEQFVLEIVKNNNDKKIGELFELYQKKGGKGTYKTFQRRIKKLSDNSYISVKKVQGGKEGNTTVVSYSSLKKLSDF